MGRRKSSIQSISKSPNDIDRKMPDKSLSTHESAGIEWWFLHGSFQGPSSSTSYFMCTLIRNRVITEREQPGDGYALLLSLLNPDQSCSEFLSRVDSELVSWSLRQLEKNRPANIDRDFIEQYNREVKQHGPPRPIEMSSSKPQQTANPFTISWDNFLLAQNTCTIELSFLGPQNGQQYKFQLSPGSCRSAWVGNEVLTGLEYMTYPRMDLVGSVDGRQVTGLAWMDHQWGHRKWLLSSDKEQCVVGWDWFGISLEGGGECMIMSAWDIADRAMLVSRAIVWQNGGEQCIESGIRIEPQRYWESTATWIEYPVSSRIIIPTLECDLLFEPLVDDQEIPIFGPMRAVWEGAGNISGMLGGHYVTGKARCELHGYGYLLSFQTYLDRFAERVHRHVSELMPKRADNRWLDCCIGPPTWQNEPAAYNETVAKPSWDLIERKGKCWRPAFALLMLETLGMKSDPYEQLICARGELPHTGALIIDDIEDGSPIRRGEESIHLRYGMDVAINAANTLYFLPIRLIGLHPLLSAKQKLELYDLTMQYYVRAHIGQALDIYWSHYMTEDMIEQWMSDSLGPKILQMYVQKTGTAVMGSAEEAAIISGVDANLREAALDFARAFGVAFQITDDVLDFSGAPQWRKECGEDLAVGKLTYVIYRALETLHGDKRKRLRRIICTPALRSNPVFLHEGIDLVKSSGVLDLCREEACTMFRTAWDRFASCVPLTEQKMLLYKLCSTLVVSGRFEEAP